jgi:hypothetical protein
LQRSEQLLDTEIIQDEFTGSKYSQEKKEIPKNIPITNITLYLPETSEFISGGFEKLST